MARWIIVVLCVVAGLLMVGVSRADAQLISSQTLLNQLPTAAEVSAGYDRALFPHWSDLDRNGCDARGDVLFVEGNPRPTVRPGCVLNGGSWRSAYDGVQTSNPSTFDIDHLVPLNEAWQSGANRWTTDTRQRFANDTTYGPSLIAVSATSNRSKGDSEPHQWMPPLPGYHCTYLTHWVGVKWRWQLSVDATERNFLSTRLAACGWPAITQPTRATITLSGNNGGSGGTGGSIATSGVVLYELNFKTTPSTNESVVLRNNTSTSRTITGWKLSDASGRIYTFPSVTVAAGATLRVVTGSGANSGSVLYWGSGSAIWNDTGDTATLRNAAGAVVSSCTYGSMTPPKRC